MNTNKTHYSYNFLRNLLLNKKHIIDSKEYKEIKKHINDCNFCWNLWNRIRWDFIIDNGKDKELKEFFGEKYIPYFDSSWALANEWYKLDPKTEDDVKKFYKSTSYYIYNSFVFSQSGDKISHINNILPLLNKHNIKSILDFGCGIGEDGIEFINNDFNVYFADFESPSTMFLKWRLRNLNYSKQSNIINVETITENIPEVDMVWCIDVLEHMIDPLEVFNIFSKKTKMFIYYIDSSGQDGGRHPFHFEVNYKKIEDRLNRMGFIKIRHKIFEIWKRG